MFLWLHLLSLLLLTQTLFGAQYQLSTTPLFLGDSVQPNVFFMLDDSGSMDWEILTKKHWHYCAYDPDSGDDNNDSSDCGYEVTNGLIVIYGGSWSTFEYIYNNTI